ncbi:MAG TPA: PAS domain S-box protein [Pyrinomonadaceae bacterium]|nr:PAS domain S-box protein [Pyrinomonadaceae bacterium]
MKPLLPAFDLAVFQRLYEAHADQTRDHSSYAEAPEESTLLTLMGNLPGMVYCCRNDEDWTMLFVSEGCLELTGYAPVDLVGDRKISYADLIHPDDRQKVWEDVQAALAARTRFRLVYRLLADAPKGEKWVWEQGHGIFSPDGELLAIEGFATDVTDRVQSEEALREAELKYRSIFEQAVHGIYRSTPDGQFLAANPAMAKMLGYGSPEELIADCTDIARDFYADAETRSRLQTLLAANGKVQGFEARVMCRDRSVIWMRENIYAVSDASGALLYYEGSVEDITARKRAEEMLARSEEQYRVLFESNPNPMWVYDSQTFAYLAVNEAAVRHYGYTREEFLRMTIFDVRPPENIPAVRENIAALPAEHRYAGEWEHRKKDGTQIFVEISSQLIDFSGHAARLVLVNDVTERKHAEALLRESEERYRELFENANDVIYTTDLKGRYLSVNRVVEKVSGYTCAEVRGMNFTQLVAPEYLELSRQMMARKLAGDEATTFYETEIIAKSGERVLLEVSSQLIYDEGVPVGVQGIARDITMRKRAERALRESEERYRELFENANDLVYTHDLEGNFTSLNNAGERVTGYTREEAARLNLAQVVAPDHLARAREMMTRKESVEGATVYELDIIAKDGRRVPLEVSTRLVYENGEPCGVQGIARDIAERKHTEAKLLHNAYHDALTGLPNRNLFTDHLQMAVERARRHDDYVFAVLFLDLDRFKNVNDSLGHTVGDQLLVALSRRLQHCLRPSDVVARLGGDEFAILLNDIGAQPAAAVALAERVQQELMQPFNLGGHEVFTTASIGIALSTTGYETPEAVLRDADTVMYRAKAQGKARHEVFDQNMHARVVALLRLENDLRRAVERDELRLHYQPIVSLASGRISGFEALVRWQHPELGLIMPADFIPVAEETGVIVELGQWVLEESCRQMRDWQMISPQHSRLKLSVNLSSRHFVQPDLYERIVEVLGETGLAPDALQLEITESVLMENAHTIVPLLGRLRELGVELAIDDFGTGYSSLSYLSRLKPIHTLKIDRSFISMGGDDHENAEIVRTIIMLARNMGKDVVAEGIETAEQLARLRTLKCTYGQGYLFSRPQDPTEIERRLRTGLHAAVANSFKDELSVA